MSLTLSQAKKLRGGLVFFQKEARRRAIPSNTSKVREHCSTRGFWRVDDQTHRPLVFNVAFLEGQTNARVSFEVQVADDTSINWHVSPDRIIGAVLNHGPIGKV